MSLQLIDILHRTLSKGGIKVGFRFFYEENLTLPLEDEICLSTGKTCPWEHYGLAINSTEFLCYKIQKKDP